jgi:hypothetical protein
MRQIQRFAVLAVAGAVFGVLHAKPSQAKPEFVSAVPNAPDSCLTCHTSPPTLNVFGLDVQAHLAGGVPNWLAVCALDSDKDGKTNGAELGDPCCTWTKGTAAPYTTGLSKPSDATSKNTLACVSGGSGGSAATDAGNSAGGAAGSAGGAGGAGGQTSGTGGSAAGAAGATGVGGAAGASGATGLGGSAGATGVGGAAGAAGATDVGGSAGSTAATGLGGAAGASGAAGAANPAAAPSDAVPADSGGASCRMAPHGGAHFGALGLFGVAALAFSLRRRRSR